MAMPGMPCGLNHSLDIHAWGRSRIPRSSSSSWRLLTQSASQVPLTVTLRLLRRRSSNCSSDSVSQAYFRRGIGLPNMGAIQHRDDVMGCWWQQPPRVAERTRAGPYYSAAHVGCGSVATKLNVSITGPLLAG